jgi:hypothetical protein
MTMSTEGVARPRRVDVPTSTIIEFLASTSLFSGCDRATITRIAPHVFPVEVPAGTVVVRAGAANPGIGVVYTGRAAVRDGSAIIEHVPAGHAFGETGAFLGTTQPHEVAAAEDSVMLLLSHDIVNQLASKSAAFSFGAARRLAARTITTPIPTVRARPAGTAPPATEGIRFVRVSSYDPTPEVIAAVPGKLIQQHRLLPLELRDRNLVVGMVDPTNAASRMELQRVMSTSNIIVVAISQDDFNEAYVRLRIDPVRATRGTRPLEVAVSPDQRRARGHRRTPRVVEITGSLVPAAMAHHRLHGPGGGLRRADVELPLQHRGAAVVRRHGPGAVTGQRLDLHQLSVAQLLQGGQLDPPPGE